MTAVHVHVAPPPYTPKKKSPKNSNNSVSPSTVPASVEPAAETTPSVHPKVDQLRAQLAELNLNTTGTKAVLQARLRRALKSGAKKPGKRVHFSEEVDVRMLPPVDEAITVASAGETTTMTLSLDGEHNLSSGTNSHGGTDDNAIIDEASASPPPYPATDWRHVYRECKRADTSQPYDFYLVLDVEATCDRDADRHFPNEIIEFPVVLINGETMRVVDEFHSYVRPTVHPKLSAFCIELTGIDQATVDAAPTFSTVLRDFETWLSQYAQPPYRNTLFITDGPWDIRDFIRKQCHHSRISRPGYLRSFVDLRRLYTDFYARERQNLNGMLEEMGMRFEGREHSGRDDARNIARIAMGMMNEGCLFTPNYEVRVKRVGIGKRGKQFILV
ncbi:ribonuclease H-like domain-containing protein [Gaertneriomyces semiglobifer]|nr:ribonuclease H-like domain-containing protein [Gaertneriomyces semiglobifer]